MPETLKPNDGQIKDPRLLPCPFCGSSAAIYMPRHKCYAVACLAYIETFTEKWDRSKNYCYCRMGGDGLEYGSIDSAVQAWNQRVKPNNIGLTYEEIIVACKNIGINLKCAGCASCFFTGHNDTHDENCTLKVGYS